MEGKLKVLSVVVVTFILGLGLGRYLAPSSTSEEKRASETIEVGKEVIETEKENADGSKEKTKIVREIKKEIVTKEVIKVVKASSVSSFGNEEYQKSSIKPYLVENHILSFATKAAAETFVTSLKTFLK